MNRDYTKKPSRKRIIAAASIVFALIAISIIVIGFLMFRSYTIDDHIRRGRGLAELVSDYIDAGRVTEYLEKGRDTPGYAETEAQLYKLRQAVPDAKYLYVYQIREDGCHVVFDLDTEDTAASQPGDVVDFDPSFNKYIDDLLAGRPVEPIISNDRFGYLLTIYTPVCDAAGQCQCYSAVDFSMDHIVHYGLEFIGRVTVFLVIVILAGFAVSMLLMERGIVRPMKQMDKIAFRDALTGLRNRAAYTEYARGLDRQIREGGAAFAIAMIDVNYLKRVNDAHGHDKGNAYLIACANAIAEAFGRENIFRYGGDEFIVTLEGDALARAEDGVRALRAEMERKAQAPDLEPWERVSAAVGLARFEPGKDTRAEDVLRRADAAMYADKQAMKAGRE